MTAVSAPAPVYGSATNSPRNPRAAYLHECTCQWIDTPADAWCSPERKGPIIRPGTDGGKTGTGRSAGYLSIGGNPELRFAPAAVRAGVIGRGHSCKSMSPVFSLVSRFSADSIGGRGRGTPSATPDTRPGGLPAARRATPLGGRDGPRWRASGAHCPPARPLRRGHGAAMVYGRFKPDSEERDC